MTNIWTKPNNNLNHVLPCTSNKEKVDDKGNLVLRISISFVCLFPNFVQLLHEH